MPFPSHKRTQGRKNRTPRLRWTVPLGYGNSYPSTTPFHSRKRMAKKCCLTGKSETKKALSLRWGRQSLQLL